MAFFKKVKAFNRKIEIMMVIDNLLNEVKKSPLYGQSKNNFDTESLARMIVDGAWSNNPDIFTGKFGQIPHRLSAAAFSISRALTNLEGSEFSDAIPMLSAALIPLLDEINTNGRLYGFNSLDGELIKITIETLKH